VSQTESSVCLPLTLAIGFTGHRSLPNQQQARHELRDLLKQQKDAGRETVYGVSSVAAGGDLLFAETCIELGIPLRILLPFEEDEFRKDFDPDDWSRVAAVLKDAASIEVTGRSRAREERYYECGIETVHQCAMLVALWDGEPSRGKGGTQEIVSYATKIGRPVFWIHSETGQLRRLNETEESNLRHDPELQFLNQLPDCGIQAGASAGDLARAWFRKIDENASRFAPQTRRLASVPVVYTAAAAVCSEIALLSRGADSWLAVSVGLGIVAAGLPALLRLEERHALWARTRTAAEACRSVLALWHTPGFPVALDAEMVPTLSGVLASLNFLKLIDRGRQIFELQKFKASYRTERLREQITYFNHQGERARRQARAYHLTSLVCVVLAILAAAWVFGVSRLGSHPMEHGREHIALCMSILFQIATVAGALIAVQDCERRQRRYAELREWLEKWDTQIEALQTWVSVLHVTRRAERALMIELLEWRALLQNRKAGGK